jgi:cation-transporting P-type ATPase C
VGYTRGLGVEAVIQDALVCVGNDRFMAHKAIPLTQRAARDVQRLSQRAANVLFIAVDGRLCGLVAYTDPVRPDAADAIRALQAHGLKAMIVLAQDHPQVTQQDINALGLSRDDTALLPEEHAAVVHHLHTAGYTVAVVSDGRDDSLVWSEADVRIALQDGLTRAQVPHVILSEATLGPLPLAIRIARDSTRLVQQHWHVITVVNTLAFGPASLGWIGPLGALGLSKGSALAMVGRVLYAVQP